MKKTLSGAVLAAGLAAGTLATAGAPAYAASTHFVAPGQSIQQAVDAAAPGDTIQLFAGEYDGGILVTKDRITIKGAGWDTVVRPGGTNNCVAVAGPSGICVVGEEGDPVRGVTVQSLTVRGFDAFGVVGLGTDKLTVRAIQSIDNLEYGVVEFGSTRGAFIGNWITGTTEEAGLYVGDIADAMGTTLTNNHVEASALGALIRHAHNVKLVGNTFVDNCTGVALVDDGQPGGMGHIRVINNKMIANNRFCPPHEEVPPLQGSGLVMVGGHDNSVIGNKVLGNQGTGVAPFSGGIVLMPGLPPTNMPGEDNSFVGNTAFGNSPADIIDNSGGDNTFTANKCATSQPSGIC
jgi:hypothetical protein